MNKFRKWFFKFLTGYDLIDYAELLKTAQGIHDLNVELNDLNVEINETSHQTNELAKMVIDRCEKLLERYEKMNEHESESMKKEE